MCNWEWKFYKAKIIRTQTCFSINFGGKLSFILSFLFPERLECCYIYIFTAPTCTTTIITFEPCPLNVEFQHFILTLGESRSKDRVKTRVTLPINLFFFFGELKTSQIQSNGPPGLLQFWPSKVLQKYIFIPKCILYKTSKLSKCCGTIPKFLKTSYLVEEGQVLGYSMH